MRIAVFGVGAMAQRRCRVLSTIDGLQIGAHASPAAAHVEEVAAQWGGHAYSHHEELLARETIDAAWIAVPPDQHEALEMALIFDFARYINGEAVVLAATAAYSPRNAYPDLDVDTSSAVLLHFNSSAIATVTATCLLQGAPQVYVRFICDGLVVTVRCDGVTDVTSDAQDT